MRKQSKSTRKFPALFLSMIVIVAVVVVGYALATNTLASQNASGETLETMELTTMSGESVTIPDTSRNATVVFTMAYWCGTCIPEAQALAQINEEFEGRLHIVMVDIDPSSTPNLLRGFINEVGENTLTWTLDAGGSFVQKYNIRALDGA